MVEKNPPKLTLLIGPAGTGKTHACLNAFGEAICESRDLLKDDLLLILPTVEHRERTIDLLLRRNISGFFQKRITTFDDAFRSFLKLGNVRFASDVTRRLTLKDVINQSNLVYLKDASKTVGFLDLLDHWTRELKESLVRPEDFQKYSEKLSQKFPPAKEKYLELARLYTDYQKRLDAEGLIDSEDALFLVEEGLKKGQWESPFFRHVWIDGFFDFSKLQLAFIRFLAARAASITVTLTLDESKERTSLFHAPLETKQILESIGFSVLRSAQGNQRAKVKMLVCAERGLFCESKPEVVSPGEAIQIFEAAGLIGELEMIAREIKKTVLERRYYYSDIALIFRRAGPYVPVIRSVFSRFEIPVEIHEREELRLNPLARTVLSLLRIFLDDWKREDLFNFLKSSYTTPDYETVCGMERKAYRQGLRSGRESWLQVFEKDKTFQRLAKFQKLFSGAKNLMEMIQTMKRSLDEFGVSGISEIANEENRLDHAALKRIYLLLDEIKNKFRNLGGAIDFQTFAETFIRLMEVDLFSVHDRNKNKVQVYNISLARQKEYKMVFLPGLLEKQFPIQVKEDPVLNDEERRLVNDITKQETLKERLPRQAVERFFFYLGVTRASEKLILSYPRFDLEGKEALPSFYVDEIRSLFSGELPAQKQTVGDVLPKPDKVMVEKEILAQAVESLYQPRGSADQKRNESFGVGLYNALAANQTFQKIIHSLLEPIEGRISDAQIRDLFLPKEHVFTPTRLEEYAECPYRYFANEILRLENEEEGIDLRVVGNILHETLEQFHEWAKKKGLQNVGIDEAREQCQKFLEQAHENYPISGDRWYKIELAKRDIAQILGRVLVQEIVSRKPPLPGLIPSYFEYQFGFKPKNDYLILRAGGKEIKLRGKIDRIDVDPSSKFGLVIDYKTGKSYKRASLEDGTELQLPLYLLAIKQNLGLEPIGGHLYSLSKVRSSGFHLRGALERLGIAPGNRHVLSDVQWKQMFERIGSLVFRLVDGIECAKIPVTPRDCVSFCPFSSVCRIEKWRLETIYSQIREEDLKIEYEKEKNKKT